VCARVANGLSVERDSEKVCLCCVLCVVLV